MCGHSEAAKKCMVNSVVSSRLLLKIAERFGAHCEQTLTGFKWMGNKQEELEKAGFEPMITYEEAIGYAVGGALRDKDGVSAMAKMCEIVAELASHLGVPMTPLCANYLLLGISSDTGNFAHKNVTQATFAAAADLVSKGAEIYPIQYNLFKRQSAARALLFGRTMSAIRYFEEGKIAFISVSAEQLKACGATSDMTEGFIDFPLSVDGVEVAVCLLETGKERYKISLRSKGKADVNAVASVYGGGGHVLASGCMISGCLEEVIDKLRFTISQYL